jgi:hypothetical protein
MAAGNGVRQALAAQARGLGRYFVSLSMCVGSMLAGASVVHWTLKPDTTLPIPEEYRIRKQ